MSSAVQVFLHDARVPTVDEWNAAIKAEGFDLVLDSSDLRDDDGYLPALLKGQESGFEWYLSDVTTAEEDPQFPFKAFIGDCDRKAQLCFTSHADEDVTASIAGAVLAKLTGGYYWDPETDRKFLRGEEAIAAARTAVKEWERDAAYKPKSKSSPPTPPVIVSAVPPPLNSAQPPLIQPPFSPAIEPRLTFYRVWCGVFVLIWSGMLIYSVMTLQGRADPALDFITDMSTLNDPVARAKAFEEVRDESYGAAVVSALGAIFYCVAIFVPRKPWGWTIGLIAILGSTLPFIITLAGAIPLTQLWLKPETKRYFAKEP
ncbi:MAG: hypothetical protein JWM68_4018 [Verrucomicrobiales bacterium]|nr:hypothetical protein [Verrucomicrobiales bacterium]